MNTPEAVVFDLGKVLVDFDYSIAVRRLTVKTSRSVTELADFLLHTPTMVQYERGLLSDRQFYQAVCDGTGYCGTIDEFAASFGDIFAPIDPMILWQQSLRSQGIPTYIFSNTNTLAVDFIRRTYPFFSNFDGYILSYEQRSMKPEAKIYEAVECTTGKRGKQLLYLDDRAENIEAGSARGWHTILHQTPQHSFLLAKGYGLAPPNPILPNGQ